MQKTLAKSVTFEGRGLHLGRPARLVLRPAAPGRGIVFRRTDLAGKPEIPARWDLVAQSPLMTRLVGAHGASVATVEHVMAALAGCGIANAVVDVDGPEAPIMDGSAAAFARGIVAAGTVRSDAPLRAIEVLREVRVADGAASAWLSPAPSLRIDFTIEFPDAAIGRQHRALDMANGAFLRDLCDSRTFCRSKDVEAMRAQGLALGGSYENAVVVEGDRVLTPGGLRHADEAVRHKMLDALGDLALAGAPLLARYTGRRAGHTLTNRLLRRLFSQPGAWRFVTCGPDCAARLPGHALGPEDLAAVA